MSETKQRHGCLTAYLIFMIIAGLFTVGLYLFAGDFIFAQLPDAPEWSRWVLIAIGILNIVFAVAIFMWQKWGFLGFAGVSIITFGINLMIGTGIFSALLGFVGVAILYGVLQIGEKDKGWPQLE